MIDQSTKKDSNKQETYFKDAEIGSLWQHHPQEINHIVAFENFNDFEQITAEEVWFIRPKTIIMKLSDLIPSSAAAKPKFKAMFMDYENNLRIGWVQFIPNILIKAK